MVCGVYRKIIQNNYNCKGGLSGCWEENPVFMHRMEIDWNSVTGKTKEDSMKCVVLLAINRKMYKIGLITKEEKEAMDIEILREK